MDFKVDLMTPSTPLSLSHSQAHTRTLFHRGPYVERVETPLLSQTCHLFGFLPLLLPFLSFVRGAVEMTTFHRAAV